MWQKVGDDLGALLSRGTYPALRGIPSYDALFRGLVPDPKACLVAGRKIANDVMSSNGIRDFGRQQNAKAEVWTGKLFRASSPRNNPYGNWWFGAELVERWERRYPATLPRMERRERIFESLRPMLAVCLDWNDFTELWMMAAAPGGIPVITGQGKHQPLISPHAKTRYDPQEKVLFIGGYPQVYVPFVPKTLVARYLI